MMRSRLAAVTLFFVLAVMAAACGQPLTSTEETQTAQAGPSPVSTVTVAPATTPTTVDTVAAETATAEPTAPSPPQALAPATPAPVTPVATGPTARTDCPAGWVTFVSAGDRISVCSPPELSATTSVDEAGSPGILVSADDLTGVPKPGVPRVLIAAQVNVSPTFNPNVPLASLCAIGAPGGTTVELSVGAYRATGCHLTLEKNSPDGPLESLMLVAPVSPSYFLNMTVNWRSASPGAHELAIQIAGTLSVTS